MEMIDSVCLMKNFVPNPETVENLDKYVSIVLKSTVKIAPI